MRVLKARLGFLLREVGANIASDWLTTLSAVVTVGVALCCAGAAFLFLLNLDFQARRVGGNLEVRAFFSGKTEQASARQLSAEMGRWPGIAQTRFIPREEGWREFQQRFPHEQAFSGIDNPVPDVVAIKVKRPELLALAARRLERLAEVEAVRPSASEILARGSFPGQLIRLLEAERVFLWGACALLGLSVLLVVQNTIRLALHRHWREISIMQFLGARSALVAGPFLLGGLFQGLLGALFSLALLLPGYWYLGQLTSASEPPLIALPREVYFWLSGLLLGAGGLLGLTGALLSLRRFLQRVPEGPF